MADPTFPRAVLFDLLTALLDSWSLWNDVAGSETKGRAWRAEYLRLTYGCGSYVSYESLVLDAARATGLPDSVPQALEDRWLELAPWSGVPAALAGLRGRTKLAVVTNCSKRLGLAASDAAFVAGSGYDLIGTSAVGLRTYWHNRVGLKRPAEAPAPDFESPDLNSLIPWLEGRNP